ncbi:hypothetical protein [uncultured Sphingomonas sp.]|uniref:hypothetical protein n=1 Tax=uncultured Sphingomonas sp. TaxID=158754 RepID=UPI00258DB100|nr:hypothetical protein [uncultured Sphingomonas sp.]
MTLKTSLLITGDSSVAQKAVADLARSVVAAAASAKASAAGFDAAARAEQGAAAAAKEVAASASDAADAVRQLSGAATGAAGAVASVGGGAASSAGAVEGATGKVRQHTKAVNDNEQEMRRHAMGVRNLGQQFADLGVMVGGGISPIRAFATQAGQMGYALSEMGGRAGAVGAVLTGPFGIGLTVALSLLAPTIEMLLDGEKAADALGDALAKAAERSDSFGNAQSLIGKAVDLATGKLKTHNAELRETIRLQAEAGLLAAQQAETEARKAIKGVGEPTLLDRVVSSGALSGPSYGGAGSQAGEQQQRGARSLADNAPLRRLRDEVLAGGMDASQIRQRVDAMAKAGQLAGRSAEQIIELKNQLYDLPRALNDQKANRAAIDALDGKGVAAALKPYERPRTTSAKKSNAAALGEFGRDAGDRIASITERFDDTAPLVRQVLQARRELDDLMDDLARRKPPGFEKLISDAKEARGAIDAGLNRPLDDFLDSQAQQLAQGRLIIDGRQAEAEALRAIVAIERQRGPLSADQRAEVLATVEALRAQERQLEKVRAIQQVNLSALQDMKSIVAQTIYEGPQSLAQLPARLLESFKRYSAEKIAEEMFGDLFRDLRDQVMGASKVDRASNVIVGAFDRAATAADALAGALARPASAGTAGAVGAGASDAAFAKAVGAAASGAVDRVLGRLEGARPIEERPRDDGGDIVVTARRQSGVYADVIGGVLKKIGIGDKTASDIGKGAGKALAGAMEGQMAAGVAGMLGIKTSNTGGAIGGAIGKFLPIPGGSIIGGLLGGVLGGLFGSKTAPNASAIFSNSDTAKVSGSSDEMRASLKGSASSITTGLKQIAEQLGGSLGAFTVSIGKYDDYYRVSSTDTKTVGEKGYSPGRVPGLIYDGKDEAAAIAAALVDAIKDGAIKGVSPAVSAALRSTSDINDAVKEASGAQQLELLIGGPSAQIKKALSDFEKVAAERVRMAKAYGLDLLATDKVNAAERLKLNEQLVAAQVGSLKTLVQEMTSGSLFEGTAMDKIAALNTSIAKAKADLDAGVEGSADTLARLYEQRLAASKDAYGTTSAYAADRQSTIAEAQAAIARVNAQVTAAAQAKGSDPALATTNAALNENNDQNARILAAIEGLPAQIGTVVANDYAGRFDLGRLAAMR